MLKYSRWSLLPALITFLLTGFAKADVKLADIFGDHMVLQEGAKLPVWGWADPGENVSVTLGSTTGSAVAAADGSWRVDLPPVPASTTGQVLTVAGKNTLTFQDVLIGDVWLASGQSNMEFGINTDDHGAAAVAQANEPQIRLFMVPKSTSLDPKSACASVSPDHLESKWQICTPETLGGKWGWNGFSAVAYYFGREIHHATHKPIGLIGSYYGGTPAQAWTSLSGLEKDPVLSHYVSQHQKIVDQFAQATADYPAIRASYDADLEQWKRDVGPTYDGAKKQWAIDAAQAIAAGTPPPPSPVASRPLPQPPPPPDGGAGAPANLFNAMIAPLMPYGIKGVIWYQGEQNANGKQVNAAEYATLFSRLITDWREKWGQGDFPFLYVQIANWQLPQKWPSEGGWAWLREAQFKTLKVPNTGMATAIDLGDPLNVHPKDKLDVGMRLALLARRIVYGENLVASGPLYNSMIVEGGQIQLSFKEIGSGLAIGVPPWTSTGTPPVKSSELKGFAIAGEDRKWVWATAEIKGDVVTVSAAGVTKPVAVRYDWANCPLGNLYNQEGLPASPFRTDDWED